MPRLDIANATASDLTNTLTEFSIDTKQLDSGTSQNETTWMNDRWSKQWGYFNSVPDLKSAILMKAIWTVGKGYTTDPETKVILDHISGWGKDTFEDILFNMEVMKRVGGDAFAEIIRDEDDEIIINLKPLDPGSVKIVVNEKGIIKRYEQTSKTKNGTAKKFQPEDILHLSNNRLGDQIHGISDIDALEQIILADAENFDDMRKIMHRQAKPMIMFKLGTDNQTKINTFISKMDAATNKGENIYIPDDENSVNFEVIQVNVSQIILEWRNNLKDKFYRAVGLPLIVFGSSGTTESGGKIEYLAHEQVFEHDQRTIERQIEEQLGLDIDLNPPATLQENLQRDNAKDGGMGFQPSDTIAGSGR